jgi:hypothetical protein
MQRDDELQRHRRKAQSNARTSRTRPETKTLTCCPRQVRSATRITAMQARRRARSPPRQPATCHPAQQASDDTSFVVRSRRGELSPKPFSIIKLPNPQTIVAAAGAQQQPHARNLSCSPQRHQRKTIRTHARYSRSETETRTLCARDQAMRPCFRRCVRCPRAQAPKPRSHSPAATIVRSQHRWRSEPDMCCPSQLYHTLTCSKRRSHKTALQTLASPCDPTRCAQQRGQQHRLPGAQTARSTHRQEQSCKQRPPR